MRSLELGTVMTCTFRHREHGTRTAHSEILLCLSINMYEISKYCVSPVIKSSKTGGSEREPILSRSELTEIERFCMYRCFFESEHRAPFLQNFDCSFISHRNALYCTVIGLGMCSAEGASKVDERR